MPKGYWIANLEVQDAQTYEKYRSAVAMLLAEFGAKFVVRGGTQQVREGNMHSRTVVIEFPSYAEAVACYESAAYQSVKDIRLSAAISSLIIIEGYDQS